jgi:hypothetical protein
MISISSESGSVLNGATGVFVSAFDGASDITF